MPSEVRERRKVFIYEQKLYTRAQLNRHINTLDLEMDGTKSEGGGFMGHPMCDFYKTPFYGDNGLYSHVHRALYMSYMLKAASRTI